MALALSMACADHPRLCGDAKQSVRRRRLVVSLRKWFRNDPRGEEQDSREELSFVGKLVISSLAILVLILLIFAVSAQAITSDASRFVTRTDKTHTLMIDPVPFQSAPTQPWTLPAGRP
jgi:hypothetical protein